MKHLKKFNESNNNKKFFTQEEFDDIKDVLRDLLDEHNLELFYSFNEDDDTDLDEFIGMAFHNNNNMDYAERIEDTTTIRVIIIKQGFDHNTHLKNDLILLKQRLTQMGFKIEQGVDYYFFITK